MQVSSYCTIVPEGQRERCGRPGVARYTVHTDDGDISVCRCAEHDPATLARFEAKTGGLIARQDLTVDPYEPSS